MRYYASALFVITIIFLGANLAAHPNSTQNTRIFNQELVIPNGGMTPPAPLQTTRPAYSRQAWERKIEGVVTVLAEFDADGNAKVLRIVKGLGFGLDENAIAAVQQWRFAPAYRNGRRVSVIANIDVVFSMPNPIVKVVNGRTFRIFLPPSEKKDAPPAEPQKLRLPMIDSAQKPE
jgi:TonB family protein